MRKEMIGVVMDQGPSGMVPSIRLQVCPEHTGWWRSCQETSMNSSLCNRKPEGSFSVSTGSKQISFEKIKGEHY